MSSENVSSVGMMSEVLFKPRRELVDWLQRDFDCSIQKVEQCGTGAMYLQIMDKAFPQRVPMSRVNWAAKQEYEMTRNFKILQEVFKECGLTRAFEISRLIKGRHQDNLEFLQWMKYVYDKRVESGDATPNEAYRAFERRQLGQGPLPEWANARLSASMAAMGSSDAHNHRRENSHARLTRVAPHMAASGAGHKKPAVVAANSRLMQPTDLALKLQMKQMEEKVNELTVSQSFYLNKLAVLEQLCENEIDKSPEISKARVMEVLYAPGLVAIEGPSTEDGEPDSL